MQQWRSAVFASPSRIAVAATIMSAASVIAAAVGAGALLNLHINVVGARAITVDTNEPSDSLRILNCEGEIQIKGNITVVVVETIRDLRRADIQVAVALLFLRDFNDEVVSSVGGNMVIIPRIIASKSLNRSAVLQNVVHSLAFGSRKSRIASANRVAASSVLRALVRADSLSGEFEGVRSSMVTIDSNVVQSTRRLGNSNVIVLLDSSIAIIKVPDCRHSLKSNVQVAVGVFASLIDRNSELRNDSLSISVRLVSIPVPFSLGNTVCSS